VQLIRENGRHILLWRQGANFVSQSARWFAVAQDQVAMSNTRIVGVCLVCNEENFVAWSILNIAYFCDEIIVLDNNSTDRTPEIQAELSRRLAHVGVIKVEDAYDTHKCVERFAGQNYWVFGVDGDEIFDAGGLARLRPRILSGEFNDWWRLSAHAHHVVSLNWDKVTAFGYGQPDAPPNSQTL
jgi:hypothetical protein